MPKVPWWAKLDGGDEAIEAAASYDLTPALRNTWLVANRTRLKENPQLFSAVTAAGVPYAEARRLDVAYQSERAAKSAAILKDAGLSPGDLDPRSVTPAKAAEYAQRKQQQIKLQEQQSSGGVLGWLGDAASAVGRGIGAGANALWEGGKNVVGEGLDALEWAASPLTGPLRAGAASPSALGGFLDGASGQISNVSGLLAAGSALIDPGDRSAEELTGMAGDLAQGMRGGVDVNPLTSVLAPAAATAVDFGTGVRNIAGGVDGEQAEDMRRAGYDPDSWTARYAWYADVDNAGTPISNEQVQELKQRHNPFKVDMAREIVTSGVIEDPQRVGGLSPEAQHLYANITGGTDKEGGEILGSLAKRAWGSPGANLAESLKLERDSGQFTGVQLMGDLAAFWYTDPLAAAGTGLKVAHNARWKVDFDPTAVKDAIMRPGRVAKAWDDAIDRVDRIHLLMQREDLESKAQAAKEFTLMRQKRPDMIPYYDTLLGMRRGSITGAFFKDPGAGKVRDLADMKSSMIDIKRVADPKDYKPLFALRNSPDEKVSQEVRDLARSKIADNIGDAIMANQVLSGRPLLKNKMVMPGSVRLSQPLRAATRVFSDKAFRESGLLMKQLNDAKGKGIIDWSKADSADAALSGVVDSRRGGEWIRDNYTKGGPRSKAAYALAKFGVFRDAAVLKVDGIDTVQTFHDFVKPFLPRGQAAFLANRWAVADPATRTVMRNNMFEMLANARHARSTRDGNDFWEQQLKGTQNPLPPGQTPKEAYTFDRDKDLIDTPSGENAAAMFSSQFADGSKLPSHLEVIRNTERVGVLSWLFGLSNGRTASMLTRAVKVGKVGTVSNALRQTLEAKWLTAADNPSGAANIQLARLGLVGENAAVRAENNLALRQARELTKSGPPMARLTELHGTKKYDAYADLAKASLKGDMSPALESLLREGAPLTEVAGGRSAFRLAATRFAVDPLRRKRADIYERMLTKGPVVPAPTKADPFAVTREPKRSPVDTAAAYRWMDKVDREFADELQNATYKLVGGDRAHYMDGGRVDDIEQIEDGLRNGQRLAALKLTNTHDYLGAAGDGGALRWANALNLRAADPVGGEVMQALARLAMHELGTRKLVGKARDRIARGYAREGREPEPHLLDWTDRTVRTSRPHEVALMPHIAKRAVERADTDEHIKWLRARGAPKQMIDQAILTRHTLPMAKDVDLSDPTGIAKFLLMKTDAGENYRLNGRRAQFHNGRYVDDPAARDEALEKWAADMTEDVAHYMGLRNLGPDTELNPAHIEFLRKVANGKPFSADDVARIPDEFRPEQVHAPVIVGKQFAEPGGMMEKVARASSKYYNFAVARPLQRMISDPQVVAAHREVMDTMEPLAKALETRGMSHQSIYNLLQTGAYGHAINRVARYQDNPNVTSYFATLSNNVLWFERAMEDFLRRAMTVTKADPAILARAHLLTEAGIHSGLVDKQVMTDEDGNAQTEYIFTYPGSGLMMRAVNESLQALGFVDQGLTPVWQDLTAPIRYLSPSLQNPLGFTTTPMVGLPMRMIRSLNPETAPTIDTVLAALEGGERHFASQSWIESLLPVYVNRAWNTVDVWDRSSQHASALRNALVYQQAAGKLPGPDATEGERQRALEDLSVMVQNNLIMRNLFGSVAPATPSTMGTNVSGIGDDEVNIIDRLRGVTTIRGEWFALLEQMNNRHSDSNQAYSEASIEWMRRGHGSILKPEAFLAGSSGEPGDDTGKSFASNRDLTQWMLSNKGYMELYGDAAYALLPSAVDGSYYDQIGYRLQTRYGLRQQKTGQEMYEALIYAQTNRDYYAARDARDEAIRQGQDERAVKRWFNNYNAQLETANPIWAAKRAEKSTPDYVARNVAPAVRALSIAEDVPAEIAGVQDELKLMAQLYDEYQSARTRAGSNERTRVNLAMAYGRRGDELFKGGVLNDLWYRMRVWED